MECESKKLCRQVSQPIPVESERQMPYTPSLVNPYFSGSNTPFITEHVQKIESEIEDLKIKLRDKQAQLKIFKCQP